MNIILSNILSHKLRILLIYLKSWDNREVVPSLSRHVGFKVTTVFYRCYPTAVQSQPPYCHFHPNVCDSFSGDATVHVCACRYLAIYKELISTILHTSSQGTLTKKYFKPKAKLTSCFYPNRYFGQRLDKFLFALKHDDTDFFSPWYIAHTH